MSKGKIGGLHGNTGQILSEGNVYNFNVNVVDGVLKNHQEIEFELDETGDRIKVIYGTGATKPTKAPVPKQKIKQKENTVKADNRDFLTEEK